MKSLQEFIVRNYASTVAIEISKDRNALKRIIGNDFVTKVARLMSSTIEVEAADALEILVHVTACDKSYIHVSSLSVHDPQTDDP